MHNSSFNCTAPRADYYFPLCGADAGHVFFLPFKFLTRTIVCFVHGLFYVNLSFSQSICFSFLSAPSNFNVRIHVPSTVTGFSSLAYQTVSPPDFIFFHYCVERPLSYTAPFSISHESRITQVRLYSIDYLYADDNML